jgi:hypothetical protein
VGTVEHDRRVAVENFKAAWPPQSSEAFVDDIIVDSGHESRRRDRQRSVLSLMHTRQTNFMLERGNHLTGGTDPSACALERSHSGGPLLGQHCRSAGPQNPRFL